ncbi:FIST signal transduction protein [Desulfurivibrio sp. D14AmB]|uniref:FIST signal transduction protein n=1 Tax=Desulfurivibrio sp. D14AmB TaxID=3374370 RepID=UPI00376F0E87
MKIASAGSIKPDSRAAVREACDTLLHKLGTPPTMVFAHWSIAHSAQTVGEEIARRFPDCRFHGASSCRGAMTEEGILFKDGHGLALLGVADPGGAYGVASRGFADNPRQSAARAVLEAIADAGRPGEMPDLVRLLSTPGRESEVLAGIEDVLGPGIAIIGGSAADNEVRGEWKIISAGSCIGQGLSVGVLYPSTPVYFSFHNGYSPTDHRGTVTATHGRTITSIDHRPAAQVYNEWTKGLIGHVLPAGGPVLNATTLNPLGRVVGHIGSVPYFNLAHPDRVSADGSLSTFADINPGEELVLMQGTVETLISRAGRVAQAASQGGHIPPEQISGALVTYCAGCMLTVKERIDEVVTSLNQAMANRPFLGSFTFGEQGCFTGGENRHGNLMISVIIFSGPADHGQR